MEFLDKPEVGVSFGTTHSIIIYSSGLPSTGLEIPIATEGMKTLRNAIGFEGKTKENVHTYRVIPCQNGRIGLLERPIPVKGEDKTFNDLPDAMYYEAITQNKHPDWVFRVEEKIYGK